MLLRFWNETSVANGLRVPENFLRIYHPLDRTQSRISGGVIVQTMCLRCREAGINVIHVSAEVGLRLSTDQRIIQPVKVWNDSGRRGRGRSIAIILEDPEAVPTWVGRWRRCTSVDLRVGTPVKIDDGPPSLPHMLTYEERQWSRRRWAYTVRDLSIVFDNIVKETGQRCAGQGRICWSRDALGELQHD